MKARLQEAKSTKSPETLKRIEERAAQLHLLHVEATQQRAAKENRRAKDVVAARLRREASSRQNLLSRFEEQATHNEENRRLAQQRLTEHGEAYEYDATVRIQGWNHRYGSFGPPPPTVPKLG